MPLAHLSSYLGLAGFPAILVVLLLYVVHKVKPKRVKLSAGVGKIIHLSFEADAGAESDDELPSSSSGQAA